MLAWKLNGFRITHMIKKLFIGINALFSPSTKRREGEIENSQILSFENGKVKGVVVTRLVKHPLLLSINNIPIKLAAVHFDDQSKLIVKGGVTFTVDLDLKITGKADIKLFTIDEKGGQQLDHRTFDGTWYVPNRYQDLALAREISQQADAVAITVWEGSHNPIGRAKVLYDTVRTQRPAIIFAYSFGDFGNDVWEPIRQLDIPLVLIPYKKRHVYFEQIEALNIRFNTVWICKQRLHSFELASKIVHHSSACVLDMDDNETLFASSKAAELKPFGKFTINKADFYLNKLSTRSVASCSLQKSYGGSLVRHARQKHTIDDSGKRKGKLLTAVFIGTIRPHKNLTTLVNSLSAFNALSKRKVKLVIGGDFDPPTLASTLKKSGAEILGPVKAEDLYHTLSRYDIVITGFPCDQKQSHEINKYQISSKIGDALATGKPALTPYSPSVADLKDIPGLFLFTQNTFVKKLKEAMAYTKPISLPKHFTLEHSYQTFSELEQLAQKESLAGQVFDHLKPTTEFSANTPLKTLVLVWKQQDSGIYGRRIDQIARYYKYKHPDTKIIVLEFMSEESLIHHTNTKHQHDNSVSTITQSIINKTCSRPIDGITYQLMTYSNTRKTDPLGNKIDNFISTQLLTPENTTFILFPLIDPYSVLLQRILDFPLIVDLVDNQLQWMKKKESQLKGMQQYFEIIFAAGQVVSNSAANVEYFENINILPSGKSLIIKNWYSLPLNYEFVHKVEEMEIHVVYSGNLNDRIDWELFDQLCKVVAMHKGYVHVVGSTVRKPTEMLHLLDNANCIYHGVMAEKKVLELLTSIDFAVVPHARDHISQYMDPIKLRMYKVLGIKSLVKSLPGLPNDDPLLEVAESNEDFLDRLNRLLENCKKEACNAVRRQKDDTAGEKYSEMIDGFLLDEDGL
ncbi:MAG: Unknown protein [uncultured Thiotrichaceae bacterium]|uniref:Uncharacterized protein n=1 Tax=uncultured Thiotrichaceae bacterium TaxID=298394 RepID=A0A6S6S9R6_9GAMM|nr:MAG: Unknown protein [uncultured Thiotrichaceae bacterium]